MTTADVGIDERTELGPPPPAPRAREPWPGHRPLVWAPRARTVDVVVLRPGHDPERRPLRLVGAHEPGYWRADDSLPTGTDYFFSVDDGDPVPDPCSPELPAGTAGPSRVLDHTFAWTDTPWRGLDLSRAPLLHVDVATFTVEGTLDAAAGRLDAVAASGVAGVELAPVTAFDPAQGPAAGVRLFAVHEPYGGPRSLQRFVDAAHGRGLAVVLDVPHRWAVADALGLHAFGPYAAGSRLGPRTGARPGPDGQDSPRINLDGSGSRGPRDFLIADADRWFREFHVDGLLLDVEALVDRSPLPFLGELAEHVRTLGEQLGRRLSLLTDGPGRSDRLTSIVGDLLTTPDDAGAAQDLRRLAREIFSSPDAPLRQPPSHRRARRATQRATSVLVGELTRLPAAARAVPWSLGEETPPGDGRPVTDDERASLLTFAVLAGTPLVLDTDHVPVGRADEAARHLVSWTHELLALRPAAAAEVDQPVEVRAHDSVLLGWRGATAVALATGDAPATLDVAAALPVGTREWDVSAAWVPRATRLEDGRLTLPPRAPVVLRRAEDEI